MSRGPIRRKKFFATSILLLASLSVMAAPVVAAVSDIDSRIAAEERRRKDLDKRIQDYRKSIKEMGAKVQGLLSRIDELKQDESVAEQEMALLELQEGKIQEDMTFLNAEMMRDQMKIDELRDRMQHRLIDMYKYGVSEEMNLLLASENVFEAVESAHLLSLLSRHDEALLDQLQSRYQNMELSHKAMDSHRARLNEQSKALKSQRERYQKAIKDTNAFIGSIQKQKALAERASREAEEAQKAVGQTILALRRRKAERGQKGRGGAGKGIDHLAGRGRGSMFDWPVRGQITSGYGQRVHPVFKTKSVHSGIDIAAPAGTAVKSAAPGEVLFDGWLRGYGQVIILDHGRNYSTVYAHLSSTAVREGQIVKAGAVIGRVGKTGTATGYHLHFEVRVGSAVKDPLAYLKR